MPQQVAISVENNFTKGLITESTGLNFPENAATDTDNCVYDLTGNVLRRLGFDKEINGSSIQVTRTGKAMSTYKWNNAGGDGETQVVVSQIGNILSFYVVSAATNAAPLSTQILSSTVDISVFKVVNSLVDPSTVECTYADGNGYLFVYNSACEVFYCTYSSGVVTALQITIQTRDFAGIPDGLGDVDRPSTLSQEHLYNLQNQGWTAGALWDAISNQQIVVSTGSHSYQVQAGLADVTVGQSIGVKWISQTLHNSIFLMSGVVSSYSGTTLVVFINYVDPGFAGKTVPYTGYPGFPYNYINVRPIDIGFIDTWLASQNNYPSNSDVWWRFKDTSGIFNPTVTEPGVTLGSGPAAKGHFILNTFTQQRSLISSATDINDVITTQRPTNGTWFQGRVWYAGVNASQPATGDVGYYTWTENIYFSQIIKDTSQFGKCYQTNDPTSEGLFDLLPTDGGVIVIQGCGAVYKLFPTQNGLLVFASNGVWFITGSTGIGFAANDYTVTKISNVRNISTTSFVNVMGMPYFWNEEGIYSVTSSQTGSLEVNPITVGTILDFYLSIPAQSKRYVRGDYNPNDYVIQWVYRDTSINTVDGLYSYNKILNYNVYNKAFFPYTISPDSPGGCLNGIVYISALGTDTTVASSFKYPCSYTTTQEYFTFADEHSEDYVDWGSVDGVGINYVSYFITGYKLRGQAIRKFQPQYVQVFTRTNGEASAYKIQGIWDFSNNRNSGRWTNQQLITNGLTNADIIFRRHKIRGHGVALQLKITSSDGMPFDIQGWSIVDTVNTGT